MSDQKHGLDTSTNNGATCTSKTDNEDYVGMDIGQMFSIIANAFDVMIARYDTILGSMAL